MPGSRDPNKKLASFWMHKDIYTALGVVTKVSDQTMTRYILEALGAKMGFTLNADGDPVGLDLARLTQEAFEKSKPAARSGTGRSKRR